MKCPSMKFPVMKWPYWWNSIDEMSIDEISSDEMTLFMKCPLMKWPYWWNSIDEISSDETSIKNETLPHPTLRCINHSNFDTIYWMDLTLSSKTRMNYNESKRSDLGRVDNSRSEGHRFYSHVRMTKTFYHILNGCSRITSQVAWKRGPFCVVRETSIRTKNLRQRGQQL